MSIAKTVAIIGAGPAGMAAALQLHRFGVNTILFEQKNQNSLLKNAWYVENYLGCCPGESGIKLLRKFRAQLTKNKVKTFRSGVASLSYNIKTQLFKIKTDIKNYFANYVIVASGTKPRLLIKNTIVDINKHVFYDVFPLLKKRKKTILIIGAGDAAFDNALNLAKYNKVIICSREKYARALLLLINKAMKHRNVSYFQDYNLCGVTFLTKKKKLTILFANQRKNVYIEADYLLIAIGRLPQKDFYTNELRSLEKRLIKEEKLFLVGDVKNNLYRQIAIAVGDGALAAMRIFHKLAQHEIRSYKCNRQ